CSSSVETFSSLHLLFWTCRHGASCLTMHFYRDEPECSLKRAFIFRSPEIFLLAAAREAKAAMLRAS
ncbi:MAG: hypothetical protein RIF42_06080, partial [Parvibaculaceae bacterium]